MGIGITPEGYLAVADRYNHCIRLYKYKRDSSDCMDCLDGLPEYPGWVAWKDGLPGWTGWIARMNWMGFPDCQDWMA